MSNIYSSPAFLKKALERAIVEATDSRNMEHKPEKGHFTRKSALSMDTMVRLLLSMSGGFLDKELEEAGVSVSVPAFSQRRSQLPFDLFENVFERFNERCKDTKTYHGYRVLAADGTCINMARNPKAPSFVQNESNPAGYNQLHANPLYDVMNKTYVHCVVQPQPKADEIGALLFMLNWYDFKEKTLIVADRGYESYNLFAHLMAKPQVDFLIRIKQDRSAMREVAKLPMEELDRDISFTITTTQTNEDKKRGYVLLQTRKSETRTYSSNTKAKRRDFPSPYPMKFRVVRFQLDTGEYETLATSLPRSISLAEIKELYHARWGIETAFRELKYGLGLVNLHGKKDAFVTQEIYAAMTMANFCSRIASQVVIDQRQENIYTYKVNMKMAIVLCKKYFRAPNGNPEKLMRTIAKYTQPVRPGRRDPRNIKAKGFVGFVYRIAA